jgi:hypothetical protein
MTRKRVTLWGARSGEVRLGDRRSRYSMVEREVDRQFEERRSHKPANKKSVSDAPAAPDDGFPAE